MQDVTRLGMICIFPLTFTENDGVTPIDLTGATAKMDLRLNVTDAMVAQSMTGGIVDAVNGMMEFTLTDEETAALVPREEVNKLFVYSVKNYLSRLNRRNNTYWSINI